MKKLEYCSPFEILLLPLLRLYKKETGCSAGRLAHLLWEQGVEGSNPFTPTISKSTDNQANFR